MPIEVGNIGLINTGWRALTALGYDNYKNIDFYPDISVLIPYFKKERTIKECIKSVKNQIYKGKIRIILINDSEDYLEPIENVEVINNGHNGKFGALYEGLKKVDTNIVITVDADTLLKSDAVQKIVRGFADLKVGAVTGHIIPITFNKINFWKKLVMNLQKLEYLWGINLVRTGQSAINSTLITAGAFSAYRTGPFREIMKRLTKTKKTVGEDFDFSANLLKQGWNVKYDVEAEAYTEAPDTFKGVFRQRLRWYRGYLQVAIKTRKIKGLLKNFEWFWNIWLFIGGLIELIFLAVLILLYPNYTFYILAFWLSFTWIFATLQLMISWSKRPFDNFYYWLLPLYQILILKPATVISLLTYKKIEW